MGAGKFATWLVTAGILAGFPAIPVAQTGNQLPRDKVANVCWPELVKLERFNRIDPIPVGCELNNCCPGCPRPEFLTWRILLTGGPIDSAELEFDNFTGRRAAAFNLGGTARQEGSKIIIGKGEAIIRSLPGLPPPGEPPVIGRLLLRYDPEWGANGKARSAKEERRIPADRADAIELIVEQLLGDELVNEYLLRYNLRFCSAHQSDTIVLLDNRGGDSAALLIDARTNTGLLGACDDDIEKAGAATVNVGDLIRSFTCPSEIAIFSSGDRMMLIERPQPDWTKSDDTRKIPLQPLLEPNVVVWLTDPGMELTAESHVVNASEIYDIEQTGIRFRPPEFRVVTRQDAAIIGEQCTPDSNANTTGELGILATLNNRPQNPLFVKNTLNVYYVANTLLTGENCPANRNMQYIGQAANDESLAHEFGHSMGLWHTNEFDTDGDGDIDIGVNGDFDGDDVADFGGDNLMWPNTSGRCCLSVGQAFRLNAHCTSTLNLNGTRTGIRRSCTHTQLSTATCTASEDTPCPPLNIGTD